jgi:hypothetical protein
MQISLRRTRNVGDPSRTFISIAMACHISTPELNLPAYSQRLATPTMRSHDEAREGAMAGSIVITEGSRQDTDGSI